MGRPADVIIITCDSRQKEDVRVGETLYCIHPRRNFKTLYDMGGKVSVSLLKHNTNMYTNLKPHTQKLYTMECVYVFAQLPCRNPYVRKFRALVYDSIEDLIKEGGVL